MIFKKISLMLISWILLYSSIQAEEIPFIKGIYTKLPEHQFTFDGKKVQIIEFFSFYCSHCYEFEKSIQVIRGSFPNKIEWKAVPIYWGNGSPKPGEAYLLAVEAGKGEQIKKALFDAYFIEKRDISNIEVLEDIGTNAGLGFDFSHRLRAGDKAKDVGDGIIMSKTYDVNDTPTLIIAGNLKTSSSLLERGIDALRDNVITILRSIFEKK